MNAPTAAALPLAVRSSAKALQAEADIDMTMAYAARAAREAIRLQDDMAEHLYSCVICHEASGTLGLSLEDMVQATDGTLSGQEACRAYAVAAAHAVGAGCSEMAELRTLLEEALKRRSFSRLQLFGMLDEHLGS